MIDVLFLFWLLTATTLDVTEDTYVYPRSCRIFRCRYCFWTAIFVEAFNAKLKKKKKTQLKSKIKVGIRIAQILNDNNSFVEYVKKKLKKKKKDFLSKINNSTILFV